MSESSQLSLKVPPGTELLNDQVAGHKFGQCKFKYGLLRHTASGDVLKPICDKRSERERDFYLEIFQDDGNGTEVDRCRQRMRMFLAGFNGIFHDDQYNMDYLRLENVMKNLTNASAMDIKIGPKTYDPEASKEKIEAEVSKYKYAAVMGFRILGMRIYNEETNDYLLRDKDYGLSVTEENAASILLTFTRGDRHIMSRFLAHTESILDWFKVDNFDRYKFISSSLLFTYGHSTIASVANGNANEFEVHVRMIDFAHVFPNVGRDENYIEGLQKLNRFLQQAIVEDH